MLIQPNQTLLFIGDSITDCGRAQPVGEGRNDALGRGYVALADALINTAYPGHALRVVNMGTSGNTVRNLAARWQTDVLDKSPDWLSIMIGINDVWRQYDSPRQKASHVYEEEYEKTLRDLVVQTRPTLPGGLVLMSPFYIEPNPSDPMRKTMDAYGAIVKQIAQEFDSVFVDTQKNAFDPILVHLYAATLAWDRVHPSQTGHMALARAFLNAVGFDWSPAE